MVAFLKGIPQDVLAKASLRSKAYTRALMHFEAYILENKENIQDHLSFLQVTLSHTHTTASRLPVRHILNRES